MKAAVESSSIPSGVASGRNDAHNRPTLRDLDPGRYPTIPLFILLRFSSPSRSVAWRSRVKVRTRHASIRASSPGAQRGGLPRAHQVNSARLAQSKQAHLRASPNPSSTSSRRLGHILSCSPSQADSHSYPAGAYRTASAASFGSKCFPSLHIANAQRNSRRAKATTATARPRR
jgi:hypothetical protein